LVEELAPAFRRFHEIYAKPDDEKLVFMAVEAIEDLLTRILIKYLVKHTSKKDGLFSKDRPLSYFSVKIDLAHRLGLISSGLEEELQTLRKIRKEFKNKIDCAMLDYKHAKVFCNNLKAPSAVKLKSMYAKDQFPDTPRGNFELTVTIISCLLANILNDLEPVSVAPLH